MSDPVFFTGGYEGKLKGKNTIALGKYFSSILNKHGISKMYLSKGEDIEWKILRKKFRYLRLRTEPEEKSISVQVEKDTIEIPDEFTEHFGGGEYCITGMGHHLEIWNRKKHNEYTKYTTKSLEKEMNVVAYEIDRIKRQKRTIH